MSEIRKKFYNIFWQNKSCQNLFLLSKEEFLESKTFGSEKEPYTFSTNRVIISNAQDVNSEAFETIKYRTENHNIDLDISINQKIEDLTPIIEHFFNSKFKKAFDKFIQDFENKGWKLIIKIFAIIANEQNREKKIMNLLQEYGFIPKNLNSFKDLETYFEKQLLPSKKNEFINENTINTFFEAIKFGKELYVNHSYKKLYTTNQILVNTLNIEDNFESRLNSFHLLYESKIIKPSKEDSFIDCSHCEPLTYRGVFQLKLNPKKLKNLKCPVCSNELTYFVPYELDKEIFEIVKSQDGLLLDAYCEVLKSNNYQYQTNVKFLNNIEVDCIFKDNNYTYFVESKMYKQNTTKDKIKSKVREHFGKLIQDTERLLLIDEFKNIAIKPILLVNIIDKELISEVEIELKQTNLNSIAQSIRILNMSMISK